MSDKIRRKIEFLLETDRLKSVMRRAFILGGERFENDAEHSWHVSLMAVLFAEEAASRNIDFLRVLKMLLIHDIVEIDAGDTYAFDVPGHLDKVDREQKAADRIFAILPENEARELRSLWEEFDTGLTPDAAFALSLDRIHPMLLNYFANGKAWKANRITPEQVLKRLDILEDSIPELAVFAKELIQDAIERGFFQPSERDA